MVKYSIVLLTFIFLTSNDSKSQNINNKKLVEFGWDYPNVSFLKAHISQMVKVPFDGVVFSFDFDIYNAFDTIQHPDSTFQYHDLAKIQWSTFTDNFLFVRGSSYTGAHWLDDQSWLKISRNLKKVSDALNISKAKGIGFDPEYYYNDSTLNPWVYRASWYNNMSYDEVGKYVRKRGGQFIKALQSSKPDVKILCFWLLDLVDMQSRTQPISKTGMALYSFFIEGMLEGKNETSEIIDGNESSYWYQKPLNFIMSGEYLRKRGEDFIDKSLQSKLNKVQLAQAIYFDWIYAKVPEYDKGYDKQSKDRWLEFNLYNALKTSDKYVWFYNERLNWWKGPVDSGLEKIITDVRNKINAEQNNKANQISGKSLTYDFKAKDPDKFKGFAYVYTKRKKILEITLLSNDIKSLQVYKNSRLIYDLKDPPSNFKIDLNKKYSKKGNLIILANNSEGIASAAYVN